MGQLDCRWIVGRAKNNHLGLWRDCLQHRVHVNFIVGSTRHLQHIRATEHLDGGVERKGWRTADDIVAHREKCMPEEANHLHTAMTQYDIAFIEAGVLRQARPSAR